MISYGPSNYKRAFELHGVVFDADSLGRYIFELTRSRCSVSHRAIGTAHLLWTLLVTLESKLERVQESIKEIEILKYFMDAGEEIWLMVDRLLNECEGITARAQMGTCGFAGAMFGKEWRHTEILIRRMVLCVV
jgi:hypothetical protein